MTDYPQHEKLKNISHESQAIADFLDWLSETKRLTLCCLRSTSAGHDDFIPDRASKLDLLAEYYGIDLVALEEEKRALLLEQRKLNEQNL